MKNIYYSIFFLHYKFIQLGRAGKLWSACSSSIVMAFTVTLFMHFIIGWIFGKHLMIVSNSTLYGTILLFSLIILNIILFVKSNNYLKIELYFENSKHRHMNAFLITFMYILIVVVTIIFIGFNKY